MIKHAKERQFQKVMVKNFHSDPAWIPRITELKLVEVQRGLKWRRHVNHIKSLGNKAIIEPTTNENADTDQESTDYHPPTPEQTTPELQVPLVIVT